MAQEVTTTSARVVALEGSVAVVEVAQQGCGRCHEQGGCGGQQLTQMFCAGERRYRVACTSDIAVGDRVQLAIPSGALARSANLAYVAPVLGLVSGALLGASLAGDGGAMLGGLLGLLSAWGGLRVFSTHPSFSRAIRPYIVSRSHPV